ncbi:unnamed protein product [Pleuronectes platessa]|uniref:Uncharacterized protein n=1 Tax=Pleuronectes platessa TaxID=8262 RepID=A0A9N7URN1_PLEPL|nr:unnamed protein product [Pleuronectes platessa]
MASRKKNTRPLRQRTGQRLQRREQQEGLAAASVDPAWETVPSSSTEGDDEDSTSEVFPAASKAPASTEGELVILVKDFLETQLRREEGLLQEIRGLRVSLQGPQPVSGPHLRTTQTPSTVTVSSPRLDRPTPTPQRYQDDP